MDKLMTKEMNKKNVKTMVWEEKGVVRERTKKVFGEITTESKNNKVRLIQVKGCLKKYISKSEKVSAKILL